MLFSTSCNCELMFKYYYFTLSLVHHVTCCPYISFLLIQEMKDQCDQKRYTFLECYLIHFTICAFPPCKYFFPFQSGIWSHASSLWGERRAIEAPQKRIILIGTTANFVSWVPRGGSIVYISLEITKARSISKYFDTGCSSSCCSGSLTCLHAELQLMMTPMQW